MPYVGQVPADVDLAQPQQFAMISDGFLIEAVMGQSPWCRGLVCAPTAPASLALSVGRGCMGQMTVVDQTAPGTAPIQDATDALMKVGINLTSTPLTFIAPTAAGQSQVFLIEGQVQESDTGAQVLQYFNAANPSQPFAGPNGTGASSNTLRIQRVALQTVSGAPAATGSQVAPAVTAGWLPLYLVTLSNGQTSIAGNGFSVHPAAPFPPFALPQLSPGFSRMFLFTNTTTWTVPLGVTLVKVRMWGGGGGGGGTSGNGSIGAGGGGAGYTEAIIPVTPGQVIVLTCGAGGPGGSGAMTGGAGGNSSFGSSLVATGGQGGGGAAGGAVATVAGVPGYGVGGVLNFTGAGGGSGFAAGAIYICGQSGPAFGGSPSFNTTSAAVPVTVNGGSDFGGGGCGGLCGGAGGAGAGGGIILEY